MVYACEWNENSVMALQHNLACAGIGSERCVVYHGDNREENTVKLLSGLADRISLGLLPSSKEGWPLAVSALSSRGGWMHVHENVNVADIDSWVQNTCETFQDMFYSAGKPMEVKCRHLERVKSYAPKILHVVADLECTARDQ